jgi:hypothetical protein
MDDEEITPDEALTPDMKFARIAEEIRTHADWRALLAGTYDDELAALEEIAKHYGGESWNTGGGVYVAVVPLGPHDALAVTGEVICHYHNAKAASHERRVRRAGQRHKRRYGLAD